MTDFSLKLDGIVLLAAIRLAETCEVSFSAEWVPVSLFESLKSRLGDHWASQSQLLDGLASVQVNRSTNELCRQLLEQGLLEVREGAVGTIWRPTDQGRAKAAEIEATLGYESISAVEDASRITSQRVLAVSKARRKAGSSTPVMVTAG
jgi:hypothetical protein